ncbi:MAG TPA: hypothetical protein VF881_18420 [Polyangiaceae bacterium]
MSARPTAHIGALRLSIPGTNAALGRGVADRVATRLASELPAGLQGQYEKLAIKVHHSGFGEQEMSDAIVESLLRTLGRTGGER